MAGAFFATEIKGVKEFTSYLGKIEKKAGNAKPAFEIAGQIILKSVQDNFVAQGRPQRWRRLSAATVLASAGRNSRTKRGGFRKAAVKKIKRKSILINRGYAGGLLGSINSAASGKEATVGSPKIYAAIHNKGGKAGKNKSVDIPQREYLLMQKQDWPAITTAFTRFLIAK